MAGTGGTAGGTAAGTGGAAGAAAVSGSFELFMLDMLDMLGVGTPGMLSMLAGLLGFDWVTFMEGAPKPKESSTSERFCLLLGGSCAALPFPPKPSKLFKRMVGVNTGRSTWLPCHLEQTVRRHVHHPTKLPSFCLGRV